MLLMVCFGCGTKWHFTTNMASKHPISSWNYQFFVICSNGLTQWSPSWQLLHQNVTYWPFHAKMKRSIYIHGIWKRYDTYYSNHGLQKRGNTLLWLLDYGQTYDSSESQCYYVLDEYMGHVCYLDLLGQKARWILWLLIEHHPSVQKQFLQTELCPCFSAAGYFPCSMYLFQSFSYNSRLKCIHHNIFQQKVWKMFAKWSAESF